MAKKKSPSLFGAVVVAAILGIAIGVVIFNPLEDPPPAPPEIDYEGEYDDEWGKLATPVNQATVTHVLISWKGNGVAGLKEPNRTQEQARELVEEIWHRYRNDPTDKNWKDLQAEYNEDNAPHTEYEVNRGASLVQPFKDCSYSTKVNFARICESNFGYHLIRREK